jgi:formiminoglutamase
LSWPRADVWLARDDPDPEIILVGVPSSAASLSPSRADRTPGAVRERLGRFSTYHGEHRIDFGEVPVSDAGNWPVSELGMHVMPHRVEKLAEALPPAPLTLYVGGDNAITRPLVRAAHHDLDRVGVVTFDAHHDVRSLTLGPSNGAPIRGLIEEDGLPGNNVVQIGIHSFANSAEYRAYCDEVGISVVTIADIEARDIGSMVTEAIGNLATRCELIYVDVDLDVLDRAFAPGCPGARPGGLTVRQLAEAVSICAGHRAVRFIDFVEVDAEADREALTLDALAHLLLSAAAGYASRGH